MKKVILIFPDSATIADFVIIHGISNTEVNSKELTLTAFLTEEQIVIASTMYGAIVQSMFTIHH